MNFGSKLGTFLRDSLQALGGLNFGMKRSSVYTFECFDSEGNLKWSDQVHNLVTTAGLNDSLTQHFKASAYTAAWYVGLTSGTPTLNAADTMASHGGWTEITAYSGSNRPTLTLGSVSAGSVDNSASKAVFTFTGSATVGGAFVTTGQTAGGTTGVLYGEATLSANRSVVSTDTLTITVTLTAS
jgi:hypothetical protein